jgi:hypothetical protein
MTSKQAKTKLRKLQHREDEEREHWEADKILCDLLTALGYEDVVKEFNKVGKWYS